MVNYRIIVILMYTNFPPEADQPLAEITPNLSEYQGRLYLF